MRGISSVSRRAVKAPGSISSGPSLRTAEGVARFSGLSKTASAAPSADDRTEALLKTERTLAHELWEFKRLCQIVVRPRF